MCDDVADRLSTYDDNPVPFSPVPTEHGELRFQPDDEWTYNATPMRVLWETYYRDAAHDLIFGRPEAAHRHAAQGRAMESAYIQRIGAEARASNAGAPA